MSVKAGVNKAKKFPPFFLLSVFSVIVYLTFFGRGIRVKIDGLLNIHHRFELFKKCCCERDERMSYSHTRQGIRKKQDFSGVGKHIGSLYTGFEKTKKI